MVEGSCHCGAVRIAVPGPPEWVVTCNCSICTKAGTLVAYYHPSDVRIEGETATYLTGDRFIRFHHCPVCACRTHWSANPEAVAGELPDVVRKLLSERMGVQVRLLDGFELREGPNGAVPFFAGVELEVRFFDNAG